MTVTSTLIVDTNVLKVDPVGNKVGINNLVPVHNLDVGGNMGASNDVFAGGNFFLNTAGKAFKANTDDNKNVKFANSHIDTANQNGMGQLFSECFLAINSANANRRIGFYTGLPDTHGLRPDNECRPVRQDDGR